MPSYQSPGVYIEEVEAGSRPIEGVGTAVAAFVGLAARGPFDAPTLVTNWSQYVREFGEFVAGEYLAHAVYGYFLNGGGVCYVVRVGAGAEAPAEEVPPAAAPGRRGARGADQAAALPALLDDLGLPVPPGL
ncbi:phage tail sheath family protein, partial [Kitasatospora sp. NPDC004289]